MPRKHSQQPEYFAGDPRDPQGMHVLLRAYVDSLRVRNYAEGSIRSVKRAKRSPSDPPSIGLRAPFDRPGN